VFPQSLSGVTSGMSNSFAYSLLRISVERLVLGAAAKKGRGNRKRGVATPLPVRGRLALLRRTEHPQPCAS